MNIFKELETGFKDVGGFLSAVVGGLKKIGALYNLIKSNGTKALILKIASDVLTVVQDAEEAAAADGLNFVLDEAVFTAAKQLIADAEAGDPVLIADLAALGITVGSAKTATASTTAVADAATTATITAAPAVQVVPA